MGDLVNLRRERKRRQRDGEAREAAENRIAFGRTKAETSATAATLALADRRLDGARRQTPPDQAVRAEGGDDAGA